MEKTIKAGTLESWENIKKRYPDSFVLIGNPEYDPKPYLKRGIFLYKSKNRRKATQKELELNPVYSTILYTGGIRLDRVDENLLLL